MKEETAKKIEYALKFAALGWRVVHTHWPIGSGQNAKCSCGKEHDQLKGVGKHPIPRDWVNQATTNPEVIRAWFTVKPDANLSIVTGPESGNFVLDVDPDTGGIDTIKALTAKHGDLPPTPTFFTGGLGYHFAFNHPGWYIPTKSSLGPGLDLRGNGGQIVAPPSRHVTGAFYEIDPDAAPFQMPGVRRVVPVADAPEWLLTLISSSCLNDNDPNKQRPRFNIQEALNGAPQGRRDETIFKLAAKMRDEDIPLDMALDWIRRAAENCDPPFPIKLAEAKVHWAYSRYTPRVDWNRDALNRREPPRQQGREWVKPYPLGSPTGKPLPPNIFPTWLDRFITMVSTEIQVPTGMVATICLSSIAACVAKKGSVRITPSWKESLNLYTVVACPPSSRKTPTFKAVTEPIFEFEERLIAEEKPRVAALQVEREALRLRLEKMKKEYAKGDLTVLPPEIAQLQLRIDELEGIDTPCLLMEDTTPEKLATMLFRNNERVAILSSEGRGVFLQMCGKYTANPDPEMYIKGWSGDRKKVHRVGRSSEFLSSPTITLSLAVQPKIMRGIAKMAAADQGLLARILYCFPEDNIGTRKIGYDPHKFDPKNMEYETRQAYLTRLEKLLRLSLPEFHIGADGNRYDGQNVLAFDDDALKGFLDFEDSLEVERGKAFDDDMREWLGKLGGNIARVIGILHLADNIENCHPNPEHPEHDYLEDVWKFPIMGRTVEAGVKLGEWFMTHAVAAFEEMQSDPIKNYAIVLAKWIRQKQLPTFYKSEAIQKLGGTAGDKASAALTFLAERGYIRTSDRNAPLLSRDNLQFEVNPSVLSGEFKSLDEEDTDET